MKGQDFSTTVSYYNSELFLSGNWMNLDIVLENFMDLVGVLTDASWAPYAQLHDEWFLYVYGEFWSNAKETEDGIIGTIGDKEYLISQETVAAASLCQNTEAVFSSNWELAIGPDVVDMIIYRRHR